MLRLAAFAALLLAGCSRPPPAPQAAATSPDATATAAATGATPEQLPEHHTVATADGAAVHLVRYPAAGPPVVMVHGISSNHRTWDLDPEHSLARALQARGYDAWLLDLRGHGLATHDAQGRRQRAGWTMDDYGRYDLPAAIDHVRAATGHDRVGYVGHSMGGMVAAIYNALHGDDALAALVVVGSPVDFGHPEPLLGLAAGSSPVATTFSPTLATPVMARAAALAPRLPLLVDPLLFASDNVDEDTRKRMYRSIVSPMSRGELQQLRGMMAGGGFTSADGTVDYAQALAGLRTPLLVIAGRGDHIAPVDRVTPWIELSGSTEESLFIASRANGLSHDYGHLDLAMGEAAPREIHPRIVEWMQGRWD